MVAEHVPADGGGCPVDQPQPLLSDLTYLDGLPLASVVVVDVLHRKPDLNLPPVAVGQNLRHHRVIPLVLDLSFQVSPPLRVLP